MSFLDKLGIGVGSTQGVQREDTGPIHLTTSRTRTPSGASPQASSPHAPDQLEYNRLSNGLKELLWNLDGLERGALLDLGPAWQTTLSFFIARGFRVSSEDILRAWKTFLAEEEARLRKDFAAGETLEMTPSARAARFLKESLQYPRSKLSERKFAIPAQLLRCRAPLGPLGLSRASFGEADCGEPHGITAARRRGFRDVSQQEAGRVPALPCCGREYPANGSDPGFVPGAEGLSEQGNPGSLRPLSDGEILCRSRSTARDPFHQVTRLPPLGARELVGSLIFLLRPAISGSTRKT